MIHPRGGAHEGTRDNSRKVPRSHVGGDYRRGPHRGMIANVATGGANSFEVH